MIERSVTDSLDAFRMLNRTYSNTLLTQSCFFASKTHSTPGYELVHAHFLFLGRKRIKRDSGTGNRGSGTCV